MSDWGYFPAVTRWAGDDATGYKTQCASVAAANTKSAWTQLAASCPFDSSGIIVEVQSEVFPSYGPRDLLVDIGIGGAGSETVLIPNIFCPMPGTQFNLSVLFYIPAFIAAATRVAARSQCSSGNTNIDVKTIFCAANGAIPQQTITDYGTDTTNSKGTVVTGGAANTKGSWSQLTASCNVMSTALICTSSNTNSSRDVALDIGIGGAGSEVVVFPDLYINNLAEVQCVGSAIGNVFIPLNVPAGTRIAARLKDSVGSSATNVSILGFA